MRFLVRSAVVMLVALLLALGTAKPIEVTLTAATPLQGVVPGVRLNKPTAPTTVAGYRAMFAKVPTTEWGAADLTISTRLGDGRRVWLFGDTLSQDEHGFIRFVHSTAMTQRGSSLHVSRHGAQVLPNRTKRLVYWIETVRTTGANRVRVEASLMHVDPSNPWGFVRARAEAHAADLKVTPNGDVIFEGWRGWVARPDVADGGDFAALGPHHFTYGAFVHDIRLSAGRWLESVNQNWDDALANHQDARKRIRFNEFRPLFRDSATRTNPYKGY